MTSHRAGWAWRLPWAAVVLVAFALLGYGLWATVYFAPTDEALEQARTGWLVLVLACVLFVIAAATAGSVLQAPTWAWGAVLVPVVLTGGLALVASGSLFPQLSLLVSGPAALASLIGGVVAPRRAPAARSPVR
ncbi:hypothetical protein [uncultured Pseudokineococcus sp.]|uniref:hypothetical protein n=1 Tax=uncultured Pseudokineococcus sp. TaxID=1642928 RepID=UPI0026119C47|nr:hypothetical protein [uncultured Pseudokineococcus sp.]